MLELVILQILSNNWFECLYLKSSEYKKVTKNKILGWTKTYQLINSLARRLPKKKKNLTFRVSILKHADLDLLDCFFFFFCQTIRQIGNINFSVQRYIFERGDWTSGLRNGPVPWGRGTLSFVGSLFLPVNRLGCQIGSDWIRLD